MGCVTRTASTGAHGAFVLPSQGVASAPFTTTHKADMRVCAARKDYPLAGGHLAGGSIRTSSDDPGLISPCADDALASVALKEPRYPRQGFDRFVYPNHIACGQTHVLKTPQNRSVERSIHGECAAMYSSTVPSGLFLSRSTFFMTDPGDISRDSSRIATQPPRLGIGDSSRANTF